MINRNNKKGFTIVELVIVIAVIAILAAVLIPTFSGIIRKANISADTQLAKNLNEALAADEAIDGKPANFSEVLVVFRENGYIVANLNPTAAGCYFVWESETNQIILVDAKNNYEVIYTSKELTNKTPCNTWNFAINDADLVAEIKALNASSVPNVVYTPKTNEDMEKVVESIFANTTTPAVETIVVSDALELGELGLKVGHVDSVITVDLAGNSLATDKQYSDAEPSNMRGQTMVAAGTLNLANGTLTSGSGSGCTIYIGGDAINNQAPRDGEVSKIFLQNMTIQAHDQSTSGSAKSALVASGKNSTATIKDSSIVSTGGRAVYARGGSVVLENVTITSKKVGGYGDCVSVAYGEGKITATNCKMTASGDYVVHSYSGGTITINDSDLVRTDAGALIHISAGTTKITLNANVTLNGTKVADITDFSSYITGGTVVKNADGSVTVTRN